MRKQELIHLHALLAEVKSEFEVRSDQPVEAARYEAMAVTPVSITRRKADHEQALQALARSIAAAIADERPSADPTTEVPPATPPSTQR